VRRRRGRPAATPAVSESTETGGRKIRLRRTRAEPEMTKIVEAEEEEPAPRRSHRTRYTTLFRILHILFHMLVSWSR
jgi:hypothetical protein